MTSVKQALVVRGGWDGHVPVAATDRYVTALKADGYAVTVSGTLDSYLDEELLAPRTWWCSAGRWARSPARRRRA